MSATMSLEDKFKALIKNDEDLEHKKIKSHNKYLRR